MTEFQPLVVFLDVQDFVFTSLLESRDDVITALMDVWEDIYEAHTLYVNDKAFSPLSMLTSVRGHGNVP